jgi:hypothetical protein
VGQLECGGPCGAVSMIKRKVHTILYPAQCAALCCSTPQLLSFCMQGFRS